MANPERKILIPDGDTASPHPFGVCGLALGLRDRILRLEDVKFGRIKFGRCRRREGPIKGCLVEIIPSDCQKSSN